MAILGSPDVKIRHSTLRANPFSKERINQYSFSRSCWKVTWYTIQPDLRKFPPLSFLLQNKPTKIWISILLIWLPPKVRKINLPCYFTYSSRVLIRSKRNRFGQNLNSACRFYFPRRYPLHLISVSQILFFNLSRQKLLQLFFFHWILIFIN